MRKQLLIAIALVVVMVGIVMAAQDKYTVKVPGGLQFSEFRGYEDWRTIGLAAAIPP